MESVAPPGGVMLSDSTARLVEHVAVLGEPELVIIKGSDEPVTAHGLLGVAADHESTGPAQPTLVGRDVELHTITGMLDLGGPSQAEEPRCQHAESGPDGQRGGEGHGAVGVAGRHWYHSSRIRPTRWRPGQRRGGATTRRSRKR